MAKKLYEEAEVRAVASAIRQKNNATATYKLSEMPAAIEALNTGEVLAHAQMPEYIKSAVYTLAQKVRAVQNENTITFIAAADAHQIDTSENVVNGNLHAGMAMKALAYVLPQLDFCCFLGDYSCGTDTTTFDEGRQHFNEINADIGEAFEGIPQFRTSGERDGLRNALEQNGDWLKGAELYTYIGRYCAGASYGSTTEGYCYRDFTDKKLRVICLNTAENGANDASVSSTQTVWLARTLRSVGSKEGWGVLLLSHHPLDFGANVCAAANILKCYVEGSTASVGAGMNMSFANYNKAKLFVNIHGHTHNFLAAKLSSISDGTATEFDVMRVATPNMCYFLNNELGANDGAEYAGIEFGQEETYAKTGGSAQDTSFVVNVLDPVENKLHSFCYGAGIDRVVSLSP